MDETVSRVCCGILPADAPLANPYVPFQPDAAAQYTAKTGLIKGTLFPCLNLPFMGMVNTEEKNDTMMHQLQALGFAPLQLCAYHCPSILVKCAFTGSVQVPDAPPSNV